MNDKSSRILKPSYLVFVRFDDTVVQNSAVIKDMEITLNQSEVLVGLIY